MNYTQNYQLPQWAETDRIMMEDFNDAFAKVEEHCGNCRIAAGSYVGTGEYGEAHPCSLTFDFPPLILWLDVTNQFGSGAHMVWFRGQTAAEYPGNVNADFTITWEGNTVSWYQTYSSGDSGPAYQLNVEGTEYHYIVAG